MEAVPEQEDHGRQRHAGDGTKGLEPVLVDRAERLGAEGEPDCEEHDHLGDREVAARQHRPTQRDSTQRADQQHRPRAEIEAHGCNGHVRPRAGGNFAPHLSPLPESALP